MRHEILIFFVTLLYSMDKKWVEKFNTLFTNKHGLNIHKACNTLNNEGFFDHTGHYFIFNVLEKNSPTLRAVIREGVVFDLIRFDSGTLTHHLDILKEQDIAILCGEYSLDLKKLTKATKRLNELLALQEKTLMEY